MNLESLSDKHLHEIERLARELCDVLRKAKLKEEPLTMALHELEVQAGNLRRERYDADNPEFKGY